MVLEGRTLVDEATAAADEDLLDPSELSRVVLADAELGNGSKVGMVKAPPHGPSTNRLLRHSVTPADMLAESPTPMLALTLGKAMLMFGRPTLALSPALSLALMLAPRLGGLTLISMGGTLTPMLAPRLALAAILALAEIPTPRLADRIPDGSGIDGIAGRVIGVVATDIVV